MAGCGRNGCRIEVLAGPRHCSGEYWVGGRGQGQRLLVIEEF